MGDKYLARNGYDSQQTNEPRDAAQPDNLFQSVPGQFGAHGRFDGRAQTRDNFFELTKYVPFNYLLIAIVILLISLFVVLL
jgi:hypothetical protein